MAGVGAQVAAVERGLEDAFRRVLEDRAEEFLALAQLAGAAGDEGFQARALAAGGQD